ncbi:MAG TPA: signal peptidase I [Patescibacteria group bacterium]|nr:signal peptidase I [Patescibacteria group bacterium]
MEDSQNKNPVPQQQEAAQTVGSFIWDLVKILVIALVIIIPFRTFIAEPFVVSGASMLPNFRDHDYLIVDRLSYLHDNPQRGDVIVLLYPKDTSQFFIKRVIGLPGETVSFAQGEVKIINAEHPDGFYLKEPYLPAGLETIGSDTPVHLGSGEYFVLGDNRTASSDSRIWGILPRSDIVGRVALRIYPFGDFGAVKTPSYQ